MRFIFALLILFAYFASINTEEGHKTAANSMNYVRKLSVKRFLRLGEISRVFPNKKARIATTKEPITATTTKSPTVRVDYSLKFTSLAELKSYMNYLVSIQSKQLLPIQIQRINEEKDIFGKPKTPFKAPEIEIAEVTRRAQTSQFGFIRFG